ncbi:MAG: aminotransferase class I/II-fold pyridoxal phosphate-dependent enzyme, partial [Candidatus Heimdallarchaeota archaeon]|nr:aminotransferase class I/II-fold pyridoxal phosphate-dependent enzyme [Candidatus Heimdallarchaeota archaeon]
HTSTLIQMLAYETAKDGFVEKHIEKIKDIYGERRKVMIAAMEEHFPAGTSWTEPDGGLFLWVTLPEKIDAAELLKVAVEKKVAFVPGAPFYPNEGGNNNLRLNFSFSNPDEIKEGIERLAEAIKSFL